MYLIEQCYQTSGGLSHKIHLPTSGPNEVKTLFKTIMHTCARLALKSIILFETKHLNYMRQLIALIIAMIISGCSSMAPQPEQQAKLTPDQYYSEARKAQASGDYDSAIKYSSELEEHYPLSPYTQLVPLETAFAHYKLEDYDAAVKDADRFISTHPQHANLDYAYYLKGLIRSAQGSGKSIEDPAQVVIVDPNYSRDAFKSFSILVKQFPDSKYRDNALQRMSELRNQMARHELQAVKTKLDEGDTEGAMHLAKYISEQYSNTPAATEALELIISASSTSIALAAPSIEVMPAAQPVAPSLASETMHREAWLLQQNPKHFTLQIASSSNKENLESYIRQHKLQNDTAYFRRKLDNKDWYSLLYGNYSNRAEAISAAEKVKTELGISDIWIRQYNEVQASIVQDRSGN